MAASFGFYVFPVSFHKYLAYPVACWELVEQSSLSFFFFFGMTPVIAAACIWNKKNIPLQNIYKNTYKINAISNTVDHEANCRQWHRYNESTRHKAT